MKRKEQGKHRQKEVRGCSRELAVGLDKGDVLVLHRDPRDHSHRDREA